MVPKPIGRRQKFMITRNFDKALNLELVESPQLSLLDAVPSPPMMVQHFSGAGAVNLGDHARLKAQILVIRDFMADGRWHTLQNIAVGTGYPTASISAQLRNLRKFGWGSHVVEKKRDSETGGTW